MLDFEMYEVLTFDCYGTLIDWEQGLVDALTPLLAAHNIQMEEEALLALFAELEATEEAGEYRHYRAILKEVVVRIGQRMGFTPSEKEQGSLPDSIADWPPFPDTVDALKALKIRYKLAILSNIDDDLIAGTVQRLGVEFDAVITAEQVGSYKPSPRNFEAAIERIGVPREKILHVAQSLYHDIAPAKAMGLAAVWVNRRTGRAGSGATPPAHAQPDLELPDLKTLAELAGGRDDHPI